MNVSPIEVNTYLSELGSLNEGELESIAACGLPLISPLTPILKDQDANRAYQATQVIYLVRLDVGLEASAAIPDLLDILKNHPQSRLRSQAAYALQEIAPGHASTIDALVTSFQRDPDFYVRESVLQAIAYNSQGEPDTVNLLLDTILDSIKDT